MPWGYGVYLRKLEPLCGAVPEIVASLINERDVLCKNIWAEKLILLSGVFLALFLKALECILDGSIYKVVRLLLLRKLILQFSCILFCFFQWFNYVSCPCNFRWRLLLHIRTRACYLIPLFLKLFILIELIAPPFQILETLVRRETVLISHKTCFIRKNSRKLFIWHLK